MAQQSAWGDTGKPLAKLENVDEDESWLKFLPSGSSVISAKGHAASYWSQTARIDVQLASGESKVYFLKLTCTNLGKIMVEGEFESMKLLHTVAPHMVPKPVGYGTYASDPDIHFFLCEYVDLREGTPDEITFCKEVADLHINSVRHSPNNNFGFHVTTCNGTVRQDNSWTSSWETFFLRLLKDAFNLEQQVQGISDDIASLLPAIYDNVVPRLLRPLETEGRNLVPCLVHGDLWDGNVAVHTRTGQPYIFDAAAFWAHNEYEMHIWRGERFRIRDSFVKEYFKHFPPSPPEEDWEDRNLLYSLMADLHDSILFKDTKKFRGMVVETMRELVAKLPNGYEGKEKCKDA